MRLADEIMKFVPTVEEYPMDAKQLMGWVEESETHRKIVGDYHGSYALGVTDSPPAFLLRVEPTDVKSLPTKVTIQGVEVAVVVQANFVPPVPITAGR
jgi:hypothetical protein